MGRETVSRWQQVTRWGALLGLALLVGGFVVRDIRARAFVEKDLVALGLWIGGGVLVAAGLASNYRALLRTLSRRRTAEGLHFGLVLVLALTLAALVCYIGTRRYARMDWTGQQKYRLHSKTENILRNLDRDVDAIVLFQSIDADMAFGAVHDMLEEFRALSPRVHVEEIDYSMPENQKRLQELVRRLGVENLPAPSVVFATAERHEVVPFAKIAHSSRGPMYPPDTFSGEEAFAGALTKLIEAERVVLYALTGHGERPLEAEETYATPGQTRSILSDPRYSLSIVVKALKKDNYDVKPLNLKLEGRVPDDCAALIIAGPRAPLAESEIEAIRDYLDNRDGRALIMAEPEVTPEVDSNLEELLQPYGIRLRTDALGVVQAVDLFGGRVIMPSVPVDPSKLGGHPATADLANYDTWLDQACPIEIENSEPGPTLEARALLTGIQATWGETEPEPRGGKGVDFDPARDVRGPVVVGAVVQPASPPGLPDSAMDADELPGPRIVVFGGSLPFTNASVTQYPGNRYLLLNCINWMAGRMHLLGIPPKSIESEPVPVSPGQIVAARYLFIGILPGCIVLLGIGVWLMRRR